MVVVLLWLLIGFCGGCFLVHKLNEKDKFSFGNLYPEDVIFISIITVLGPPGLLGAFIAFLITKS